MGRKILNRKELRADYEASERRKDEDPEEEEEAESEEDEEEEEGEDEEAEDEGEGEDREEEEEEKKPAKKRKAPPPKTKPRTRTPKVTRMRVVWGVFNNSNQCVTTYEYPRKQEAVDHAARLTADKRSTHFVQPVKEPMEEKKEK